MNEAETRAELIDPKLKACGWGAVEAAKDILGEVAEISSLFIEFQQHLYSQKVA